VISTDSMFFRELFGAANKSYDIVAVVLPGGGDRLQAIMTCMLNFAVLASKDE